MPKTRFMRNKVRYTVLFAALFSLATACFKDENFDFKASGEGTGSYVTPSREVEADVRNVLVYVAGGFNSLSNYLADDIEELRNNMLPGNRTSRDHVLLVLSRLPVNPYSPNYSVGTSPVLFRLYADENGNAVSDTLCIWSKDTPLSKASTIREALEYVQRTFPGNRYGMILSSHASGWLPSRYYNDPSPFESPLFAPGKRKAAEFFPPLVQEEGMPAVKSFGVDEESNPLEIEIDDLAAAIPLHLDYLLFDACLMGCVEVAYELREVADLVGFSPTEVLADGFDYTTLTQRLLIDKPDPVAVCREYFNHYDSQTGAYRSATISLVDTREMDSLAELCGSLFEKYRSNIAALSGANVQGYFRKNRHYFYDLQDILVKAGISEQEKTQLQNALDRCLVYKAATPSFLEIDIDTYSGFSMYLPSRGSQYLNNYYRSHVAWNKATGLIK